MNLINIDSRRGFVNLFADFILQHLDHKDKLSQIQVTDCINFIVVGGKTEFKEVLDISEIKSQFIKLFDKKVSSINLEKFNIVDLIEYDKKPDVPQSVFFGHFYKTNRPIYNEHQLTAELTGRSYIKSESIVQEVLQSHQNNLLITYEPYHLSSEFPHGFSINNLRNKLYYLEYVSFNLFTIQGITKIKYLWDNNEITLHSDSFVDKNHIESIMKDVFDFDLLDFNKKLNEYSFLEDLLSPKESKPWLNLDKASELFII